MSVADVFLDIGKARADGHDQRAIVRVVQRPTADRHQRFLSVERDWTSSVDRRQQEYLEKRNTATRFSPIAEEEERPRDAPFPSVENTETVDNEPRYQDAQTIPGTPPLRSMGSEELGDSSSPHEQNQNHGSRKRKTSAEPSGPAKHRRVDEEHSTQAQKTISPQRKRTNVPTFASPHRRPSLNERQVQNENIGLGVTKSPQSKRTVGANIPSSQNTVPVSTPTNASAQSASKHLHSAMRKSSPTSAHADKRRSVSFNEPNANGDAQSTPRVDSSQTKSSRKNATNKAAQKAASQDSPYTPSNRNTMTPDQHQRKLMDDQFARIKQEIAEREKEKAQLRADLENPDISTESKNDIQKLLKTYATLDEAKKNSKKNSGSEDQSRVISKLQRKIVPLRNRLARNMAKNQAENPSEPAASKTRDEPSLPVSETTVNRSIPSPSPAAAPAASQPETWSFGRIASPSTRKPESQSQPTPPRRVTRSSASASASQESRPQKSPTKSPAPQQSPSLSIPMKSPPKKSPAKPQTPVEDRNAEVHAEKDQSQPEETQQEDVEMEDAGSEEDSGEEDSSQEDPSEESSSDEAAKNGEASTVETSKPTAQMDQSNSDQDAVNESDEEESREESPTRANGFVDDAAEEDDREEDEEQEAEGDEEMEDFIDDGPEESEESEEEETETKDSGAGAKFEAINGHAAEKDHAEESSDEEGKLEESQDEESDEGNGEEEAPAEQEEQTKPPAVEDQPVKDDQPKENQEESLSKENDDSEYESLESSDDSDSEIE